QQPAPGIPGESKPLDAQMDAEGLEIGYLFHPADRHLAGDRRATATPLVVIDELPVAGESVELWEEILVMGTRTAVQNHDPMSSTHPPHKQGHLADGHHCLRGAGAHGHDGITGGPRARRRRAA